MLAQATIRRAVFRTPLRYSQAFSQRSGSEVYLKLENWQPTGSYKVRGAVNFLSQLTSNDIARGLVTASAGNHALSVGYAAAQLGIKNVTVFVPRTAPRAKIQKLKGFPVRICESGNSYDEAHRAASEFEKTNGATFIHPYDDTRTAAGTGTIGLEVLEDLPDADAIIVPVGGGGLISGIAMAAKAISPDVKVYGIQPDASPALKDSLRDGRCYEEYDASPTICDGLAGGTGQMAFDLARSGKIDDVIVVTEANVRKAVATFARDEQMIVEGSGAVGLAALEQLASEFAGRRVVLVVSGANLDAEVLSAILQEEKATS